MTDPLDLDKAQLGAYVNSIIWRLFDKAAEYGLTREEIAQAVVEQREAPLLRSPDGTPLTWGPMVRSLADRIEQKTGRATDFVQVLDDLLLLLPIQG
jgi:hypothetical protein